MEIKNFLTDQEIGYIESFCANETMYNAVHKVVMASMYYQGVIVPGEKFEPKNLAFNLIANAYEKGQEVSNEALGAELRGLYEGANMVEQGFTYLKRIKRPAEPVETPYNEAV